MPYYKHDMMALSRGFGLGLGGVKSNYGGPGGGKRYKALHLERLPSPRQPIYDPLPIFTSYFSLILFSNET